MNKILRIELRSDLCAGVGKHYASVIDLDTALDEYGIPFIPARRLKGCMRELAEELLGLSPEALNGLFGERGAAAPGALRITDARIPGYNDQLEEIRTAMEAGAVRANDVTGLFCSVRAGTAIENDTAKKGTLRFVRVVNRLAPGSDAPLAFYAGLECADAYDETVTALCKGLRNIGYKRNRGLGLVSCTLLDRETPAAEAVQTPEDAGRYLLRYVLYLNEDLMLPAADANRSMDYIPGTAVLGALASKYVKLYGTDGFNDVFLGEDVRFGNLYLSDKNGADYVPAPRFLARIKAAGKEDAGIHNMAANMEADAQTGRTPQYKPLKTGYISEEHGYGTVRTEIVYHNALNTAESRENNGGLYTQYCISSGQYFKGAVYASGAVMKKLLPLFGDGSLFLGRSKTAQYAHCVVRHAGLLEDREAETAVTVRKGTVGAFICESDVVLTRDGRYTVSPEALCGALTGAAGAALTKLLPFTALSVKTVSGYNAKWNHKKPQFPAICAGSTVVFEAEEDFTAPAVFTVGEKQREGFGRIRLAGDAKAYLAGYIRSQKESNLGGSAAFNLAEAQAPLLRAVYKQKERTALLEKAIKDADRIVKRLNPSQVGRLTLMCRESQSFDDLEARLNSIKTESFRKTALECVMKNVKKISDWTEAKTYAVTLLTVAKYRLKKREGK